MARLLLALVLCGILAGCATYVTRTEGARIGEKELMALKPGETTRDALLKTFGTPADVTYKDGKEMMVFKYKEIKTPTYLGGKVESELQSKVKLTTLEVTLTKGIVTSYSLKNEEDM